MRLDLDRLEVLAGAMRDNLMAVPAEAWAAAWAHAEWTGQDPLGAYVGALLLTDLPHLLRIARAAEAHVAAVAKMGEPGYFDVGDTTDQEIHDTDLALTAALEGR